MWVKGRGDYCAQGGTTRALPLCKAIFSVDCHLYGSLDGSGDGEFSSSDFFFFFNVACVNLKPFYFVSYLNPNHL